MMGALQRDLIADAGAAAIPADALERLRRLGSERSGDIALLHKRRGHWRAFRWADAGQEVDRLRTLLRAHGLGEDARLAVSGAYEPDLVFLALAAHAAGAHVFPVSRTLHGEELRRSLSAIAPTHGFVQGRRDVSRWLASGFSGEKEIPLFFRQSVGGLSGRWRIVPLHDAQDANATASRRAGLARHLHGREAVWVDEGTEWPDGLQALLNRWLTHGVAVAFPETADSAGRDRREVQPTALLSSQARRNRLDREIEARLPPRGSWARRLLDLSPDGPGRFVARLARARHDEALGLRRIHQPQVEEVPPVLADARP